MARSVSAAAHAWSTYHTRSAKTAWLLVPLFQRILINSRFSQFDQAIDRPVHHVAVYRRINSQLGGDA